LPEFTTRPVNPRMYLDHAERNAIHLKGGLL
jgi:hypothetical protein